METTHCPGDIHIITVDDDVRQSMMAADGIEQLPGVSQFLTVITEVHEELYKDTTVTLRTLDGFPADCALTKYGRPLLDRPHQATVFNPVPTVLFEFECFVDGIEVVFPNPDNPVALIKEYDGEEPDYEDYDFLLSWSLRAKIRDYLDVYPPRLTG